MSVCVYVCILYYFVSPPPSLVPPSFRLPRILGGGGGVKHEMFLFMCKIILRILEFYYSVHHWPLCVLTAVLKGLLHSDHLPYAFKWTVGVAPLLTLSGQCLSRSHGIILTLDCVVTCVAFLEAPKACSKGLLFVFFEDSTTNPHSWERCARAVVCKRLEVVE